jgi:hypothetical protein
VEDVGAIEQPLTVTDGMFSILHNVDKDEIAAFRCGKLPDRPFYVDAIPSISVGEVARITGVKFTSPPPDKARILRNVRRTKHLEDYTNPREYFLDNGLLGWNYMPKTRIPGERWRLHKSQASYEISAVLQRIKMFQEGYLTTYTMGHCDAYI